MVEDRVYGIWTLIHVLDDSLYNKKMPPLKGLKFIIENISWFTEKDYKIIAKARGNPHRLGVILAEELGDASVYLNEHRNQPSCIYFRTQAEEAKIVDRDAEFDKKTRDLNEKLAKTEREREEFNGYKSKYENLTAKLKEEYASRNERIEEEYKLRTEALNLEETKLAEKQQEFNTKDAELTELGEKLQARENKYIKMKAELDINQNKLDKKEKEYTINIATLKQKEAELLKKEGNLETLIKEGVKKRKDEFQVFIVKQKEEQKAELRKEYDEKAKKYEKSIIEENTKKLEKERENLMKKTTEEVTRFKAELKEEYDKKIKDKMVELNELYNGAVVAKKLGRGN